MANEFNTRVIEEFRANHGTVGGRFADTQIVLLTTTGAKSGQPRTVPLVTIPRGDRYLLFASNGGSPTHPDWYWNLRANPIATIELGARTVTTKVTELTGAERDAAYAHAIEVIPGIAGNQARTSRIIPFFAFTLA